MPIRYTLTARSKRCDSSPEATISNPGIISVQWMNKTGEHEIEKLICSRQVQIVVKTENADNEKVMLAVKNPNRALTITNHDLKMSYFEEDDGMVIAIGDIDCNGIARFDFWAEKNWLLDGELINNELTAIAFIYDGIKVIPKKEDTIEATISVVENIVIVIDPGHGHTNGDTGTIFRYYKHKVKENGKIKKDAIQESTIDTIPDYIIEDTSLFEGFSKDNKGNDKVDERYSKWNEREIVFELALLMKKELEQKGYSVILTREVSLKKGNDNRDELYRRNKLANDNNADYYISLHVNGNAGNISKRGAFYMYRSDDTFLSNTIELGKDMLKYFKLISSESDDFIPIDTPQQFGLAIFSPDSKVGNNTKFKTLIEIGTITNPYDARILAQLKESVNMNLLSTQLLKGLYENINKHF